MTAALNERALQYACQRVEDFARLNRTRSGDERVESLDLWLDGLGLSEPLRKQFKNWVERFAPGHEGVVYLGFTVGLFINQYFQDGHT